MKCLTPAECSAWLRERNILESPYTVPAPVDAYCFQFEPPRTPRGAITFVRALVEQLSGDFSGALLVFTDWPPYPPDETTMVDALRRSHGEHRGLIEAPGHWFGPDEQAEAKAHCFLPLMYGWSAYLYFASGTATVHFWEGDLVDFWSPDGDVCEGALALVRDFKLRVSSDNPPPQGPS